MFRSCLQISREIAGTRLMFARGIISIKAISRKLRSLHFLTNVFFLPIHYSDFPLFTIQTFLSKNHTKRFQFSTNPVLHSFIYAEP